MVNLYAVLSNQADRRIKKLAIKSIVLKGESYKKNYPQMHFLDTLNKLQRATPRAKKEQFYQLLKRVK